MIHRLFAAGAAMALALAPTYALAQDAPGALPAQAAPADVVPIDAAPADPTAGPRTYAPIDYDITHAPEDIWLLDLSNGKRVAIRLMPDWAPQHVERIKALTRQGFYDGTIFHRVIDGFMAQGGDPTGTGTGGSGLPDVPAEFNPMPHVRGSVAMARAEDVNSANSQFFIVFYPRFGLDKHYTNFGRVMAGMDGVDAIELGEPPQNPTRILQASIAADGRAQAMPAASVAPATAITADMLSNSPGS